MTELDVLEEETARRRIKYIEEYIQAALKEDHLLCILITSEAQARLPSEGWSYGAGKSTLAMNLAKYEVYNGDFEQVKKHMIGFAYELKKFLRPPSTPCVIWDDMQNDVGVDAANDKAVKQLFKLLTMMRPYLKVLIGTAPYRGILAKHFREYLFHFEIFIPTRGVFEVQRLKRWTPFHRPLDQRESFDKESFRVGTFFDLEPEEKEWYLEWRRKRDAEAIERVELLKSPEEKEMEKNLEDRKKVEKYLRNFPSSMEFYDMIRKRGLKGERMRAHQLWQDLKRYLELRLEELSGKGKNF